MSLVGVFLWTTGSAAFPPSLSPPTSACGFMFSPFLTIVSWLWVYICLWIHILTICLWRHIWLRLLATNPVAWGALHQEHKWSATYGRHGKCRAADFPTKKTCSDLLLVSGCMMLVGGWFPKPFEKYARQNPSFPHFKGEKKLFRCHHPDVCSNGWFNVGMGLTNLSPSLSLSLSLSPSRSERSGLPLRGKVLTNIVRSVLLT